MRVPRRTAIVLAALAAGIAATAWVATRPSPGPDASASLADAAASASTPEWPLGVERTYDVTWKSVSQAALAGVPDASAPLSSELDLHAELVVRSHGEEAGTTLLVARLTKIDRARVSALGRDIVPTVEAARSELGDRDAVVELVAGRLRDVRFAADAPALYRSMMRAILAELIAELGEPGLVETAIGRARIEKRVDPKNDARSLTRRTRYEALEALPSGLSADGEQSVVANGVIERDAKNGIVRITSDEAVRVAESDGPLRWFDAKSSIAFALVRSETRAPSAVPVFPASSAAAAVDDASRATSLARRSNGVTLDSVIADVHIRGLLPRVGTTEWIWRDSAYLELHPDDAEALLAAVGKDADVGAQAAAFDLVVIAGTSQGEAALRKALASWGSREPDTYIVLVQRVGFLAAPSDATIDFVGSEYAAWQKKHDARRTQACAYTLGALAGAVAHTDRERARKIADRLVMDLYAAKTDDDRAALLRGLGNAGLAEDVTAVTIYASDPSDDVRAAVATALRRMNADAAVPALLRLLTDKNGAVARAAVSSLFRHTLDDSAWAAINDTIATGRLAALARGALLNDLARKLGDDPHAETALRLLHDAPTTEPQIRMRIESLVAY